MDTTTTHTGRSLSNIPLWRLLVALADAEREAGPDSTTARTLTRIILERMRRRPGDHPRKGGRHAR